MSDHSPPNDNPEQPQRVYVRSQLTAIYVQSEQPTIYVTSTTNQDHTEDEARGMFFRVIVRIYARVLLVRYRGWKPSEHAPLSGKRLMQLTDWVPSAVVRKRQRKLIADEIAEINVFRAEGRLWLARWRHFWLTLHWTRYLLGTPFAAAVQLFRKTSAG